MLKLTCSWATWRPGDPKAFSGFNIIRVENYGCAVTVGSEWTWDCCAAGPVQQHWVCQSVNNFDIVPTAFALELKKNILILLAMQKYKLTFWHYFLKIRSNYYTQI